MLTSTRNIKPVNVTRGDLTLAIYPWEWERIPDIFAAAEAYLSETDAKPGLGLEVEPEGWPGATRFWNGEPVFGGGAV